MSYVSCHECGWDNGEFHMTKIELRMLKYGLKNLVTLDWLRRGSDKTRWQNHSITFLFKLQHQTVITDIKNLFKSFFQTYKSYEDYKNKNPEGICPKCGSKKMWID